MHQGTLLGDLVAAAAEAALECRPRGRAAFPSSPPPPLHQADPALPGPRHGLRLKALTACSATGLLSLPAYWQPGAFELLLAEAGAAADRHFVCTDVDRRGPDPDPSSPESRGVAATPPPKDEWFFDSMRAEQNLEWAAEQVRKGVTRAQAGDLRDAVKHYDYALSIYPNHVDALVGRGAAKLRLGDEAAAIADLETAHQKDASCGAALQYLVAAREQLASQGSLGGSAKAPSPSPATTSERSARRKRRPREEPTVAPGDVAAALEGVGLVESSGAGAAKPVSSHPLFVGGVSAPTTAAPATPSSSSGTAAAGADAARKARRRKRRKTGSLVDPAYGSDASSES